MLDMTVEDFTHTRFYQDVLLEGKQEGEAHLIVRQLMRRCGLITPEQKQQVLAMPVADLERLGEALLDFSGAADLQDWLEYYHQNRQAFLPPVL